MSDTRSYETKCKFCNVAITLDVDVAYLELGDPFKLLKYASCNHCADFKEARRELRDGISALAVTYHHIGGKNIEGKQDKHKASIRGKLLSYAQAVCTYRRIAHWPVPVDDALAVILADPAQTDAQMRELWHVAKRTTATQTSLV